MDGKTGAVELARVGRMLERRRGRKLTGVPPEPDFEAGLEWLLDGIEAMAEEGEPRYARSPMAKLPFATFKPEARPAAATGAAAIGALAVGVAAIGGFAIGRLSVGRLAIGKAAIGRLAIKHLEVEELEIGRLTIRERSPDS